MIGKIWGKIRENHLAMMAVCCLVPVVLIFGLKAAGFDSPLLFPIAMIVCVGSHLLMMAGARKDGEACH